MNKILQCVAVATLAVAITGCTSVSRGIGSITANKYAEARSGTVWAVAPPQLEPPRMSDRTVYISYRNISDSDLDLIDELREAARAEGWTITPDPQAAKYRLRASLRFFGEVEPETGGSQVAAGMGTIAGAAVGIGTGFAVNSALGGGTAGAVGGIAAGGIAGGLMAAGLNNASRPREWAYVLDFVLEEYKSKPVTFTMATSDSSGRGDVAGVSNSRMASGGGQRSGNSSRATAERTSNYFPHGMRLQVWANQMNMQQDEAMPLLTERATKVIRQVLPM